MLFNALVTRCLGCLIRQQRLPCANVSCDTPATNSLCQRVDHWHWARTPSPLVITVFQPRCGVLLLWAGLLSGFGLRKAPGHPVSCCCCHCCCGGSEVVVGVITSSGVGCLTPADLTWSSAVVVGNTTALLGSRGRSRRHWRSNPAGSEFRVVGCGGRGSLPAWFATSAVVSSGVEKK
jgi:hypothetical protein